MKNKDSNPISQNIRKYRILNKMTQEQLAGLLELDTQYYAQLERGERNFTIEKITRICSIFHIGVDRIIEVSPAADTDTSQMRQTISSKLDTLSLSQLKMVERFIDEVVPYAK